MDGSCIEDPAGPFASLAECQANCTPTPQDFDIFGATPFNGGDFNAPIPTDNFGLDWGSNSGSSGEFILGRAGTMAEFAVTIELGDNTLDAAAYFEVLLNTVPVGNTGFSAGMDGTNIVTIGQPYNAGDKLAFRINTFGQDTSGYIRAPRLTLALEDIP